ncbi:MAG: hypothetical protein EAZ55_01930 [Cytophagales bacterium]|nr:MAG: hypothetical protein EAZ55_01930 [Cytophagales bacterium]
MQCFLFRCCVGVIIGGLLLCADVWAQKNDSSSYTLELSEVSIHALPEMKYAVGTKLFRIDSAYQQWQGHQSLAQLLSTQTGIYFKEYGAGMLSSISFRGTGAGHTAVLWNGLAINYSNVGQFDFSQMPVSIAQNIDVQYGAAGALVGNEAIGGSVHIYQKASFLEQKQLSFRQTIGSFGQNNTAIQWQYANQRWYGQTQTYWNSSQNNFPFANTTQIGQPIQHQANAQYHNYGIVQSIAYAFTEKRRIESHIWYHFSHRHIQTPMTNLSLEDRQIDENTRWTIKYEDQIARGNLQLQVGYLRDYLQFNRFSPARVQRFLGLVQYEKNITPHWQFKIGGQNYWIQSDSPSYQRWIGETRTDVYAFLFFQPSKRLKTSFNLRKVWVTGYEVPFTPALGIAYQYWKNTKHEQTIQASLGRSYRVPTLNDRYWLPGGNIDLLSEDSWSAEIGWLHTYKTSSFQFSTQINAFRTMAKDWIVWLPTGSFWSPFNFNEVTIQGGELALQLNYKGKKIHWQGAFQMAYTQATNQKALNAFDNSANKQLAYVPFYKMQGNYMLHYQTWSLLGECVFTGFRYTTTDNSQFLPAYTLVNLGIGKTIRWAKHAFQMQAQVQNLLDESYQTYQYYAMPGRNFQLSIQYQIFSSIQ